MDVENKRKGTNKKIMQRTETLKKKKKKSGKKECLVGRIKDAVLNY